MVSGAWLACALVGGRFSIDLGGAALLLVTGGTLGLGVLAIYNKDRKDAGGHG